MNVREYTEGLEQKNLMPWACKSAASHRLSEEPQDDLRTAFQRDRDRIIHSKAFRSLKHKTQVYLSPGDHYRTRLTHSMEVSQISRTIGRALRLNEDMIEAAALGHDLGHTPFGHAGERAVIPGKNSRVRWKALLYAVATVSVICVPIWMTVSGSGWPVLINCRGLWPCVWEHSHPRFWTYWFTILLNALPVKIK